MQFLPIVSAVGATGTQKSAATISMCQTLSTPLSFWEYQMMLNGPTTSVSSPCKARTSQIIAEGVVIDNLDKENNTAKISRLSASDVSFTIKCSPIDLDALRSTDASVAPKAGSGNVFLANDCLVALRSIEEGEDLVIDPSTFNAELFLALPEASRIKLVGFTEPSLRAYLSSEVKMPVQSVCPKLDVRRSEAIGEALRAISHVEVGETLYDFSKETMSFLPFATMYTICVSNGVHMLVDGGSQCLAHSCDPNTKIVIDDVKGSLKVVAIKEIKPDDVVSFNYLCTEWNMDCPFDCACGSSNCFGKIAGFRHLKREQQDKLLEDVEGNGVSPIVVSLSTALRNGARDPAVRYTAVEDFARGTTITVNASSVPLSTVSGSSDAESAVCLRDGTDFFTFEELSIEDLTQVFTSASSSSVAEQEEEKKEQEPNSSSSSSPVAPCACLVNNAIVALRDIKKGEAVTVRKLVSSTNKNNQFALDEATALKIVAHMITVKSEGSATEEEKKQDAVALVSSTKFSNSTVQSHLVLQNEQQKQDDAVVSAMNLVKAIRSNDNKSLARASLLVIVDETEKKASSEQQTAEEGAAEQKQQQHLGMLLFQADLQEQKNANKKKTACC